MVNINNHEPEVTQEGLFSIQVCVPENWTDEQVKKFANKEVLCGTEQGWIIRKDGDEALAGDPERANCNSKQSFVHIVLDA